MKNLTQTVRMAAVFCAAILLMARAASAATTIYVGTNGISATTNWSTAANFIDASSHNPETPANNAANFNFGTAVASPGIVTVNADGGYGTPGGGVPQAWAMIFGQTNGYHTVLIQPGITLEMIAANGTIGGGGLEICPANMNSGGNTGGNTVNTGAYTNYTTFTGSSGTLLVNGQLRVEAQSSAVNNHYTILDMQGLGMFVITNTSGGSPNRFMLMNGGTRSQGIIYLAQTNVITPRSDIQVGYLNTSSNSLPIGLYLGMTNLLLTDAALGNGNVLNLAIQGCTNGFIKFNPAFVGGASKPTAFLSGSGGAMGTVNIANAKTAFVPSYGIADFTGGQVTWLIGNLQMGQAGAGSTNNAAGVLTFDDGTITVNTATVGWQTASAGGVGTGVINIGTNASFQATGSIVLGATTGTVTAGDAGTINLNGGSLVANTITVGAGGTGTITMTNNASLTVTGTAGTPALPLTSVSVTNSSLGFATSLTTTNLIVGTLITSGANTINITSVPPLGSVPVVIKLIAYSGSIGGAGYDFSLGTLPPLCAGTLSNDTANSSVDLVLTSGPLGLKWDGAVSGNWDTTTTNWFAAGPNFYADGDYVTFPDGATTGNVNVTATFAPGGVTVTNSSLLYQFTGVGAIGGTGSLIKQGTGTLIIDNSGINSYSGGTTISNGSTLQIGLGDANGNLPGSVANNGALVLDRSDGGTFANTISGTGSVTYEGGNTLLLSGPNSFSGNLAVNNNSTLQLGSASAIGTAAGGLTVANGSTLDVNGFAVAKSITVSGTGVGGAGAITDNGGGVFDSSLGLATNITLAGDTTFNFPTRWDLGQSANGSVLNTGGHPYNLTLVSGGNSYFEWRNLALDAALGNINVSSGTLGIVGSTSLGSPSSTLTVSSGAGLAFYNATVSVNVNKQWDLQNGAAIQNGGGANVLNGPMTLETGLTTFNVGGTSLTLSNVLSGPGALYANGGNSPLTLWGSSPSFTGGVLFYTGSLALNGVIGSGVTSQVGTTVSGTGTANGLVDISGALLPGSAGVAGTLNAAGGLTLESGATLTMDLNSANTVGGGVNDLITITGNLAANNNPISINPIGGTLSGTYTLLTYTGAATSSFSGASTVAPSRYVFTLSNVAGSPNKVNLLVSGSGGGPASLIWNNAANNGTWDTQGSQNWSNQTTHAAADFFFTQDSVTFDDSITSAANPTTSISIPVLVIPNIMTNNSTTNYTLSGAGKISGGASIVKLGSSTLTINTTNDFTGSVSVQAGTVVQGTNNALGSATGTLFITNSATVDLNGFTIGSKPVVVSGAGVNANGSIVNNGGPVYDDGHALTAVTLAGDTTFGEVNRWDLGNGTGGTLSTGGHAYNVSVTGTANSSYSEWDALTVDPALANINILSGELGMKGMTAIGNPAGTVTIFSGGRLTFWGGSGYAKNIDVKSGGTLLVRFDGPVFNFGMTLEGGSTFASVNQPKVFTAPVSLTGLVNFQIGNASCTFSNVISGAGGFYVNNYDSNPLIFTAANTYGGPTLLSNSGSGLVLSLVGNGSISSSTNIGLTAGTTLDVSGRTDKTLTLTSVQTMEGSGTVVGSLTANAGSTLVPGFSGTGTLTVTNTAILNGITAMQIGSGANNLLNATNIMYGGTLSLNFTAGTLSSGNSFKLFNAISYSGAFAGIVPSTPGAGLTWDTSQLTVSGTLRVASPPQFGSISVSGTTLTLTGTGGTPSGTYHVRTSTNAGAPLSSWTVLGSGSFDVNGHFNFSGSINPSESKRFYILVEP